MNYPVPATFETSRKRRLRDESQKRELEARSQEVQRDLEMYERKERYEEFLIEQTSAHLKSLSAPATERLVRSHMKRIKDECPQYHWSEPTLREFAQRRLRYEIARELNLPTFEEYAEQLAKRLF
jgi:hypothetical protein